ncbi:MAG: hypothetical protein OHK0040_03930 [bacterium]
MELLAPARDLDTLKAAFDAGADAVYLGLKEFSARKRAKNFTEEELLQAEAIKKSLKKRIYVAINTVIFQDEIPQLIDMLAFLEAINVDAIIIQDYGLYELIKTFTINIPLHASTQMGTKNHLQANFLKGLGFKRIVLERQLTLSEIERIKKQSDIELEVFIHGALCFSLSGHCFFSKAFTDRSGNRGDCAQPCRWAFLNNAGKIEQPFSMKDLNGLSLLPSLIKMGITSVKIEGRMKGVDYVYPVVSAYRKAIDCAKEGNFDKKFIEEIEKELEYSTLSRKSDTGFFFFNQLKDDNRLIGDAGVGLLVGKVQSVTKTSLFFKTGFHLNVGDTVRIDNPKGDERYKIPVKAIYLNNEKVRTAQSGSFIGIPSNEPKIRAGFTVYLVHRRNNYRPKTLSIKPTPAVNFKERALTLQRSYDAFLKALKKTVTTEHKLSFNPEKEIYSIDGKEFYFLPPTLYESDLSLYEKIKDMKIDGIIISHPAEAELAGNLIKAASFFLPSTNVFAIKFLERLNVKVLSLSPDLSEKQFELIRTYFPAWIRWQNTPCCISRVPLNSGLYRLKSLKNNAVTVKMVKDNCYILRPLPFAKS